jgi:hypothetical protein
MRVRPRYAASSPLRHRGNPQVDKAPAAGADTSLVRSGEADRVDETSVWPDDALRVSDEPAEDGLDALLVDAKAAAKTGAVWFAEEFARREAEEVRSPTFPVRSEPTPVDAEVEAHAVD